MKKLFCFLLVFVSLQAVSQDSSQPAALTYKTYTTFPAFNILALDSSRFSTLELRQKSNPVVVIYFSPTCNHCQHQAEEITSHIRELKHTKVLMVSAYPLPDIRKFAEEYGIGHFPGITLGFDPEFSMGRFYEVKSLPGIFVYDKNGKLKKAFDTNTTVTAIMAAIN